MKPEYIKLAALLDRIPNGFPATESGVELKILEKLFTPPQAEMAVHLTLEGRTAEEVARRSGGEERECFTRLKEMTRKGLIEADRGKGALAFRLIPFIVGFYEKQNARIDAEFARLFEQYYREALHRIMDMKPSVHRVIPVETALPMQVEVMPYQKASHYLNQARAWGVLPCICRVQRALVGEGCGHSRENCLTFSSRPGAFDRTDAIRAITREEAFEILDSARDEGLVHSTGNRRDGLTYICNCCSCCCGVIRGVAEFGHLNAVARSDFQASIDKNTCTGCGLCVDRCQFAALNLESGEGICRVQVERCYGCGICVSACPEAAISLCKKSPEESSPPPEDESAWRKDRTKNRRRTSG
jgi:ferredoxin